MQFTAHTC